MNSAQRLLILLWLLINYGSLFAQYDLVNKTEKLLLKGKHDNAIQHIHKSILKDSINAAAYQAYAIFYTFSQNTHYHIDSAHYHNLTALNHFDVSDEKTIQKLRKNHFTLTYLQRFKKHIDSLAFLEATSKPTINNYNHYLDIYTSSQLLDSAIALRNQLAFKITLKENTYHSYRSFMERYPKAKEIEEAKARFEKLYFDESVKDGQLSSYLKFLKDHPQSVYRSLAEEQIFELSTVDNKTSSYLNFATQFPDSKYAKTALDYAYHLEQSIPKVNTNWTGYYDSLNTLHEASQKVLIPYYNNGFGFINSKGEEVIPISYNTEKINSQSCPVALKDFIWPKYNNQLTTKNGMSFWNGELDQISDIGNGLLIISKDGLYGVIHKSGHEVLPIEYSDIKLVGGKFIAYQINGRWGIASALGRILLVPKYESIIGINDFLLFQQRDKWAIANSMLIIKSLETPLELHFIYDDYESFDEGQMMVYQGEKVNLISEGLIPKLTASTVDISVSSEYMISQDNQGYHIIDPATYQKLVSSKQPILSSLGGMFYQASDHWASWSNKEATILKCDSLALQGDYFVKYYLGDSLSFSINSAKKFDKNIAFSLISRPTEAYILVKQQESTTLIEANGISRLLINYDKVSLAGDSLFIVEADRHKGLINSKGEVLVEIAFDALQRNDSITYTLLKDSKFGIYNTVDTTLISPAYEEKLKHYGRSLYIAKREDAFGLIDHENNEILPFEFAQIQYWNDTSALVKKGYQWIIWNIQSNTPMIDKISQYTTLSSSGNFQVLKIFKENGYGIINSKKGEIIPASFYNIYQIEQQNTTIYVAEKYVEEADFYVVVYYDMDGIAIFKHAMESPYYQNVNCENR